MENRPYPKDHDKFALQGRSFRQQQRTERHRQQQKTRVGKSANRRRHNEPATSSLQDYPYTQKQDRSANRPDSKTSSLQAWGYEESEQNHANVAQPSGHEALLWICFVILLLLTVVFSQHSWLNYFFPISKQQLKMDVEVLRKQSDRELEEEQRQKRAALAATKLSPAGYGAPNQSKQAVTTGKPQPPKDEATATGQDSSLGDQAQSILRRFDQLLRLDNEEGNDTAETVDTKFRDVRLFFVRIGDDGQLEIKSVLHKIHFDSTPLSHTIEQLLIGPNPQEINKGLHSMLPPDMQILNIRIVNETAFINVSEEFYQIAKLPAVLLAAIKQLVFTVTEYPNVKALRILVEGQPIFAENLPAGIAKELKRLNIRLNSELRREDLWQGQIGDFALEP